MNKNKEKMLKKLADCNLQKLIYGVVFVFILILSFFKLENESSLFLIIFFIIGIAIGIYNLNKNQHPKELIGLGLLILLMMPLITVQNGANKMIFNVSIVSYLMQSMFQNQFIYQFCQNLVNYGLGLLLPIGFITSVKTLLTSNNCKK